MTQDLLKKALQIAGNPGKIFLASANADGEPYMVSIGKIESLSENVVKIRRCVCSQTIRNLWENPRLTLYIWDGDHRPGYQLLGILSDIKDLPDQEKRPSPGDDDPLKKDNDVGLVIHIEKVMTMNHLEDMDQDVK